MDIIAECLGGAAMMCLGGLFEEGGVGERGGGGIERERRRAKSENAEDAI